MEVLSVEREGTLKHLRLNRPQSANSLNAELVNQLTSAIKESCEDGTRTLVIEGNGNSFCSGFDLEKIEDLKDMVVSERILKVEEMLQLLHHASILTVALVHGKAIGAGADLVCACRKRIATRDSKFCMPGLNFGILLGTRRLANRIGYGNAQDILIDTRVFDAKKALEMGFLTGISERGDWPELIANLKLAGMKIKPDFIGRMLEITTPDTRVEDMKDLKASIQDPGLVKRIIAYRDQIRVQAGKHE